MTDARDVEKFIYYLLLSTLLVSPDEELYAQRRHDVRARI